MAAKYGIFVSLPFKNILEAKEGDVAFAADKNMIKIKEEHFAQNGETLNFDHALGYFPIFIPYGHNTEITDARYLITGGAGGVDYVSKQSVQVTGYSFVGFNPGFQ